MATKKTRTFHPDQFGYLGSRVQKDTDRFHYTVAGRGGFPEDMLRYDLAEFATPEDRAVAEGSRESRHVRIIARGCTPARWASFGWYIPTEIEEHYVR